MNNIIAVVGRVGSGKTVVSKELTTYIPNYKFLEVSDIIKELTGRKRDTIRFNKLTGSVVAKAILSELDKNSSYVISGIRQVEILNELKKYYNVILIKLDLSTDVRLKRVNMREKYSLNKLNKDDNLDSKLGLDKVLEEKGFTINQDFSLTENIQKILNYLRRQ